MMSVVGGYSCKKIGKRLHMRTNIVTAQMSKARKYLRKIPELNTSPVMMYEKKEIYNTGIDSVCYRAGIQACPFYRICSE